MNLTRNAKSSRSLEQGGDSQRGCSYYVSDDFVATIATRGLKWLPLLFYLGKFPRYVCIVMRLYYFLVVNV